MNRLYKPQKNILDAPEIDPEKMQKVRKILREHLKSPDFSRWSREDEVALISDLALKPLPSQYDDVKRLAQQLYSGYISWKFQSLPGIGEWSRKFQEHFQEEFIE
jgi:hypothetical protein